MSEIIMQIINYAEIRTFNVSNDTLPLTHDTTQMMTTRLTQLYPLNVMTRNIQRAAPLIATHIISALSN